jgi:hypothetical protein
MVVQREGRGKGRRDLGGTDQLATAQRFRSTLCITGLWQAGEDRLPQVRVHAVVGRH